MADNEVIPEVEVEEHVDSELENRAKRMGWKPKGEYDDRGKFMSAEEYLRKAEEDLPVLRARLRKMDENYTRVLGELTDTKKTFEDFRQFMTNAEKRAYEKARKELVERRDIAVAHADTDVFHATQKEIQELDDSARVLATDRPQQQQVPNGHDRPPNIDPVAEQWVKDNPWFLNDAQLNRAAKIIDTDLLQEAPGVPTVERLAAVKAEVIRMYPDKFRNPRRSAPASVAQPSGEGGSSRSRSAAGRGYDDLPADARQACDKFVRTIKGYTRDEYLKNYDWS